jgi:nitroreductase
MDIIDAIESRRSIRKYQTKPVKDDFIEIILRAGMCAPSSGNQQPWQFLVITEKSILTEIPKIHPYAQMAKDASLAIIVCGDLTIERHKGFWVQDCSAATQNILLAAHGLGLGAVWTGIYPREDRITRFKALFGLPKHIIPLALIPIGYPAQPCQKIDRFKKERIHYNSW